MGTVFSHERLSQHSNMLSGGVSMLHRPSLHVILMPTRMLMADVAVSNIVSHLAKFLSWVLFLANRFDFGLWLWDVRSREPHR